MKPWIYEKLESKKMSQAKLARIIGVTPRTLCLKFQGKNPFLWNEIRKICLTLDIDNPMNYDWGK